MLLNVNNITKAPAVFSFQSHHEIVQSLKKCSWILVRTAWLEVIPSWILVRTAWLGEFPHGSLLELLG